jgi:dethiobiotin synthetase
MTTLFVTGAGTDIGKTFVACRLIEALAGTMRLRCIKPVVTGFDPATPAAGDTGQLLRAQGLAVDATGIEATSPWRFRAALAPGMAAAREGRVVPFDALVAFSRPRDDVDLTLVEGIGGVMAPLDASHTVIDWIAALEARVLLVVGSYLGSLSHTLTALDVLVVRKLDPLAVVVSQSLQEPAPLAETAASLERHCDGLPIMVLPRNDEARAVSVAGRIAELLGLP